MLFPTLFSRFFNYIYNPWKTFQWALTWKERIWKTVHRVRPQKIRQWVGDASNFASFWSRSDQELNVLACQKAVHFGTCAAAFLGRAGTVSIRWWKSKKKNLFRKISRVLLSLSLFFVEATLNVTTNKKLRMSMTFTFYIIRS